MNDNPDESEASRLNPATIRAAMKQLLTGVEPLRQSIYEGRKIGAHLEHPPRWALHLQRLRELEELLRRRRVEDWPRIEDLHTTFLLDHQADMAAATAEVSARLVGFMDEIVQRKEDRKYTMPSEERDQIEDLMQPYLDKYREQMLSELPIEVRRRLEEEKRRLEEKGTLDEDGN